MKPVKHIFFTLSILTLLSINLFAQMDKDTLYLDEVVVTGSKIEISRRNMPVNIAVVTREDLNDINESAALTTISSRTAGVFVTERGMTGYSIGSSSAGQISIRGISGEPNSRILVLIDGSPQYMGIFGHPLPNSYVSSDLEKVEIIKGPASILYGSNAMGGAINFITRKPEKEGFSGEARMAYGSFNTLKYSANAGYQKKNLSLFVSYNHDQTDGHRDSSEFKIDNAYIKASYKLSENYSVSIDYNLAKFTDTDPGPVNDLSVFSADITRGKTSLSLKNNYENVNGAFIGFYNYGEHKLSDGWHSNDANYGFSLFQGIKLFQGNLLTAGLDYKNFGGKGNNSFPPNDNQDKWNSISETAGYIVARQQMGKLAMSAGLRVENNSNYGAELVPQGGVAYSITPKTNLKASVSKGFRSPLIMETYLFLPNPDLEPEKMINYELGLSQFLLNNRVTTDISLFWLEGTNAIELIPNDNPPPFMKRANTGSISHKGFEIETNIRMMDNLTTNISYSYLNMKTPRLGAPAHQLFTGFRYIPGKFSYILQANYIGKLYSRLETTAPVQEAVIENYFLLHAAVRFRPVDWAELFISAKNLLNQEYQINYGYPMPGFNLMTGLTLSFR